MFAVGLVVSFVVALVVVRWLLGYVRVHDFKPFAFWRLAIGIAILALGIGQTADTLTAETVPAAASDVVTALPPH